MNTIIPSSRQPSSQQGSYHQLLKQHFQLSSFRPGQERVIQTLLSGRSTLAVFPTGGGKSLCYQLPALMFKGLTLVVSPLIALMKDQVDYLQALNIAAARLDSSQSREQIQTLYRSLRTGTLKLLYVSPERLANENFVATLKRLPIALMAVDEAHCISEWGHNFRPDYLKLAELSRSLNVQRVLALTATATPAVARDIREHFGIASGDPVHTGFYRPNLKLNITPCQHSKRPAKLLERIAASPCEAAIVYVTLQKTAEEVAAFLSGQGHSAQAYHAGLKDEQRNRVQEDFMSGRCPIVVATIAFGMGIDKANVRAIYHYNLPKSLENYMQEIGRAGRDGLPSRCELLADSDDLTVLENFVYGDTPDKATLLAFIQWLWSQPGSFDISVHELAHRYDMRTLVVNTLLTYLELEGLISTTAAFFTDYKLQLRQPLESILTGFSRERADLLRQLFATGRKGRIWLTIKPAEAAAALKQEKQRLVRALDYLGEQRMVELKVTGLRQGYRLNTHMRAAAGKDGPLALAEKMAHLFARREARDIERLQRMCQWIGREACCQQTLLEYFGEALETPCGQCSWCRKHRPAALTPRTPGVVDGAAIVAAAAQKLPALARPRQMARFLCGIGSPQASRARLGRHPLFGSLAGCGFTQVLSACENALE